MRENYGVVLWKASRKDLDLLVSRVPFLVGNGWSVRFWKDKWHGNDSLYNSFPSLFSIVASKEAWVAYVWNLLGEGGCCPLLF